MASVLQVGVLVFRVLVNTHLYVFYSYAESVVKVLAALAVRLLTLDELVLRAVRVVRRAVGKKISRLVVAVCRRAVGIRLRKQPVLYIVSIRALTVTQQIPRLIVNVLFCYALDIRLDKLIRLVVVVA